MGCLVPSIFFFSIAIYRPRVASTRAPKTRGLFSFSKGKREKNKKWLCQKKERILVSLGWSPPSHQRQLRTPCPVAMGKVFSLFLFVGIVDIVGICCLCGGSSCVVAMMATKMPLVIFFFLSVGKKGRSEFALRAKWSRQAHSLPGLFLSCERDPFPIVGHHIEVLPRPPVVVASVPFRFIVAHYKGTNKRCSVDPRKKKKRQKFAVVVVFRVFLPQKVCRTGDIGSLPLQCY